MKLVRSSLVCAFCLAVVTGSLFAQQSSRQASGVAMQSAADCQLDPQNPECVQQFGTQTDGQEHEGSAANKTVQGVGTISPSILNTYPTVSPTNRPGWATVPVPPQKPTEFQLLVADSVGKMLTIFGADLFRTPGSFAPLDRVPVPVDYVVGPGDELYVRIWGQVNAELRTTVDRNGQIFIPKVGAVAVAGIHASQLDDHLRKEVGRTFRNFDITVTLGHLRSIDVFLVGRVRRPGKYTVSSLSTLVNALFESGGPSLQGSLRRIQVKRGGQIATEFDLYDLLLRGDKSRDLTLLPGDVIFVPPVGPQVAISGSINTPSIYELKDSHSSLGEVLVLSGGLNSVADGTRVTVERIDERKTMSVAEFSLDDSGATQPVKDGDIIRVFSVIPKFENAVTLRGNVANPGRYPWHAGMRIRDLIPNREMLLTRTYWVSQNGLVDGRSTQYTPSRKPTDGTDSKARPDVDGSNTSEIGNTAALSFGSRSTISQTPNDQKFDQERLRTEVKLTAPEINWDYASIQRLDPVDLSTTIIPFSPAKAILENAEAENLELRPGDVVTIFSQHDVAVPLNRQTRFVHVEGEVMAPGIYRVGSGESLRSVIERAGGLSSRAYLFATKLNRESARKEQQESLDRLVNILQGEVQQKASADAKANPEEAAAITALAESQHRLVEQLRGTRATGRVVLPLKPTDSTLDALPEIALEDGDRLLIPARGATVSVVGAVYAQSSFLYREGATVGHYLREAGGGNRTADTKHLLLVRADGSVIGNHVGGTLWGGGLTSLRMLPGDTIVVPTKLQSGSFGKTLREWTQVASQLALTAASLSVITH